MCSINVWMDSATLMRTDEEQSEFIHSSVKHGKENLLLLFSPPKDMKFSLSRCMVWIFHAQQTIEFTQNGAIIQSINQSGGGEEENGQTGLS